MASSSTQMALHKNIDQLQRELNVERVKVSQCTADLVQYCEQEMGNDFLLTRELHIGQLNNYKDKKGVCTVL